MIYKRKSNGMSCNTTEYNLSWLTKAQLLSQSELPVYYGIAGRCVKAIDFNIGVGDATEISEISELLNASPRTLQRRLRDYSTSFSEIRDEVRRYYAIRFLILSRMNVDELYPILNYSNPSTLTKALVRWIGLTPRELKIRYKSEFA